MSERVRLCEPKIGQDYKEATAGFYKPFSILGDIVQQIDRDQIDCRRTYKVSNILIQSLPTLLIGARPITEELSTTQLLVPTHPSAYWIKVLSCLYALYYAKPLI